jgi:hypothetical protein
MDEKAAGYTIRHSNPCGMGGYPKIYTELHREYMFDAL